MKKWKDIETKNKIQSRYSIKEFNFLKHKFNSFFKNYSDTWDIQWYFTCINNQGLTIMPESNLVTNIGIEGTHSKKFYKTLFLKHGTINMEKLNSPKSIKRNIDFDMKIHKKYHFENVLIKTLKEFVKRLVFKK